MDHVAGSHGDGSGFQIIATCRDGMKKSRDKSAVLSRRLRRGNEEIGDIRDKTRGSRRRRRQMSGDVRGLSRSGTVDFSRLALYDRKVLNGI